MIITSSKKVFLMLSHVPLFYCFQLVRIQRTKGETTKSIEVINNPDSKMMLYKVQNDGMDRGNHEYQKGKVVIDPKYYSKE